MTGRVPGPAAHPQVDDASDAELVDRLRAGDAAAFDALAVRHMRRAFSVAYRLLGQREDAEDLVQETLLTVLEKIDTFDSGRSFGPWFYRVLVNRGLNLRKARARRRTEPIPEASPAGSPSPLQAAETSELRGRLSEALGKLSDRQRTIVELFELEGFSGPEVAEIVGLSDGAVRWHLHEARKTLRRELEKYARMRT